MVTDDFFRARLQTMIDMRHPLALLGARLPWPAIEAALALKFAHEDKPSKSETVDGLFGAEEIEVAGGVSRAGRPRRPIRLMAGLLYLKNSFNLSDEELVQRWSENVYYQHFCGMEYFEPRLPCDATQIGRFRRAIGEEGLELLLKATIETAVQSNAVKPQELERVIVDSTVQEKAIAHSTDSRLLDIARRKVVSVAKRLGLKLKQTFEHEGAELRRRAGGYVHAKQFKRLRKVLRRQRTILCVVIREIRRKLADRLQPAEHNTEAPDPLTLAAMNTWLERAERIRTLQPRARTSSTRCMRRKSSASARCDVKSHTSLSRPPTRLVTRPVVPSAVAYLCMRCRQRRRVKPRGQRIGPSSHAGLREETASPASIEAGGMPG